MTYFDYMVDKHVKEYESHLNDGDSPSDPGDSTGYSEPELTRADGQSDHVDHMRLKSLDNWRTEEIEKAGPMGIWDAVAQQLENLTERVER